MLQNPVHVVTHLALNKQTPSYFSFLDFFSNCKVISSQTSYLLQIFAIPSYIESRNSNYDN